MTKAPIETLRRIGGTSCALFGTGLLLVALVLISYDKNKSGLALRSFILLLPAIAVLLGAIGAYFRWKLWPIPALLGCAHLLWIAVRISHGWPGALFNPANGPIGLILVVVPALIVIVSVGALIAEIASKKR